MKVWQVINKIKTHESLIELNKEMLDKVRPEDKPTHALVINASEDEIDRLRRLEVPEA